MRNLPLSTLRTFEAAARHGSFAEAAKRLALTDSAVSHQLRRLEDALGFRLFERHGRGVVLTPAGERFHRVVSDSLAAIRDAADHIGDEDDGGGRLVLACPPMFGSKWLARRFLAFQDAHPRVECEIRLMENDAIAPDAGVDVCVRFGPGGWADRWSMLLDRAELGPVCSPRLISALGRPLATEADLEGCVLLHWDDGAEWRRWLADGGVHAFAEHQRHLYCNDLSVLIDLATHGAGVALASEALSAAPLGDGVLLRPFRRTVPAIGGWYVFCAPTALERPAVRAFLRWIGTEFGVAVDEIDGRGAPPGEVRSS